MNTPNLSQPSGRGGRAPMLTRACPLADDFFLMVHDDPAGRPRLHGRILGLALACALLGELAMPKAIGVTDGILMRTGGDLPKGADPLAGDVLRDIGHGPGLPLRDWLSLLSQGALQRVGCRLGRARLVHFKPSRLKALSPAGRWTPADYPTAQLTAVDLNIKVNNGTTDPHHLMLFGLAHATGLAHPSLWHVRDRLQDPAAAAATLEPLGKAPVLLELLALTETAVTSAVTSQRIL